MTGRVTLSCCCCGCGEEGEGEEEAKSARLTATRPMMVFVEGGAEELPPEARLPDAAASSDPTARSRVSHFLSKGPAEPGLATDPSCFLLFFVSDDRRG